MVINELLEKSMTLMKGNLYANPILESILVLSKLINKDKVYIYTYGDERVSQEIADKFMEIMKKRSTGYPLNYLLGEKEFMGLNLLLEEGVLIPRPETEILVEYIIDEIHSKYRGEKISLLDIGIGSGAISLSIAAQFPDIHVYGVDLYDKPIDVAKKNKERLKLLNVEFFQSDLFNQVKREQKFHIIVSNPPYIKTGDLEGLQKDVKDFEPLSALDGGIDGLDFYKKITKESKGFLCENGLLVYEIGYNQSGEVKKIMIEEGFTDIKLLKDFQDYHRIISGRLK